MTSPSGLKGHSLTWAGNFAIWEIWVHPAGSNSHLISSLFRRFRNGNETEIRSAFRRGFLSRGHVLTLTGIQFSIHLEQNVCPHGPWTGDSKTPKQMEHKYSSSTGWMKRSTSYPILCLDDTVVFCLSECVSKWEWVRIEQERSRVCRSIGCLSFLYLFFPVITFTLSFSLTSISLSSSSFSFEGTCCFSFPGERRPGEDDDDDDDDERWWTQCTLCVDLLELQWHECVRLCLMCVDLYLLVVLTTHRGDTLSLSFRL